MTTRKRPGAKVLEEAQRLAKAVSPPAPKRAAGRSVPEKPGRQKSGTATREKIVAALKKLHPMD